jgi:eukaryotic-like serine/threonine-protein kinase
MEDALLPLKPSKQAEPSPSAASASDEVDWTGQVLGEFRLLHRLGRGGMGQVYLAEQTSLKRKVALKLLNPELASNERSLLRFKAEAENVARATHANIVQIYTIGQANGINYIALEYVEGKNLREFIEKKGTPEIALGLHIMSQVAAALQRATELGIVHRDIKPENILLTKKGEVKVADFGLSRIMESDTQVSLTQSQVTMGTPLYMSPEQVERKGVDCRTDIYSFGVTCYHMFAGTPPFRGTSPIEVAYQHVHKEPQPLAEIRPDLPIELCALVQKMMAKKPEDRFQTPREIVREINRLCETLNLGTSAVSISASFLGNSSESLRASPSRTLPGTQPPSTLLRVLAVLTVLMGLAGGLYFGWYQHHRIEVQDSPTPPPAPSEDIGLVKLPDLKARERELRGRVDEHLRPEFRSDVTFGLKFCVDLGMFYLKHHRLEDADAFFQEISKSEQKVPAYRMVGRIGHASVLAFQDKPDASNKAFLELAKEFDNLQKFVKAKKEGLDEVDAYKNVWKYNPQVREMAARALNHNFANQPEAFGEKGAYERLNVYREPPSPQLKAPPPPQPMNP